jgi:hypothetical protein
MASSGNFSTFNPLDNTENNGVGGCDFAIGNCQGGGAGDNVGIASTIATGNTGKYYAEFYLSATPGTAYVGYYPSTESAIMTKVWVPSGNRTWLTSNLASYAQNGYLYKDGSSTSSWGSTFTTGDIIQIAIDADNDAVYYGKNNTWQNSGNPESGASKTGAARTSIPKNVFPAVGHANGSGTVTWKANFGQDSTFGGTISAGGNADANGFGDFKYAPPSGYLALCSANLPISDDIDPAQTDDNYPGKQFGIVTWTGNQPTGQTVSGLGFKPDLIWAKMRSSSQNNQLFDSSRLNTRGTPTPFGLRSDTTGAEFDDQTEGNGNPIIASFDTDGFTLGTSGSGPNDNNRTYVAWCWRANGGTTSTNNDGSTTSTVQANPKAGFSIITYAGNGSNRTIGHGLSSAPDFMIFKDRNTDSNWVAYARSQGAGNRGQMNNTNAWGSSSTSFQSTDPTSSVISLGTSGGTNASGNNFVCYAWHNVEGFQKFGTYIGNYNTDGTFIYTGFRPRMLFVKRSDATNSWFVWDTARTTFNKMNSYLYWDLSNAEETGYAIDVLSNGFKLRGQNNATNNSGGTFVYGAWGDVPFKYNNTF